MSGKFISSIAREARRSRMGLTRLVQQSRGFERKKSRGHRSNT